MGTVAVTGSAGGIGGAIRRRIEAAGHRVIGVDLRDTEVVADLSSADGRIGAVADVVGASGGTLDGLVVAAGIGGSTSAPPATVVRINYFGAVALLEGLHQHLTGGELRAAVAISSNSATAVPHPDLTLVEHCLAGAEDDAATVADTMDGEAVYALAKLALARAVRRFAVTWAPTVRANAVAPGPVLTALTRAALDHPVTGDLIRQYPVPLDRWGEPEEIAAAVWFLLSPESAWVTGSILFVDGGTDALLRPDGI
jgi:NAD(P)-dependent dehydrogenase (short-subunit alcohol dehydrogenase family)